jgi:hypothetical protein
VGIQLTGGPYTVGSWTHVVTVWNGTTPTLYVNGVNTNATVSGAGGYNPNSAASPGIFSVGSYDTGSNPFTGAVDETAFYNTALTPAQILAHFNAASSPVAGTYSSLVVQDGAVEYLRNIPEPTSLVMLGLAGSFLAGARRRTRR